MTVKSSKAASKTTEKTKFITIKDKQNLEKLEQRYKEQAKAQLAFERKHDRIIKQQKVFDTIKGSQSLKSVIMALGLVFAVWCILEWTSSVRFEPAAKRNIWNETF